MYNALSKEEGFPEFYEIESAAEEAKAIIERNNRPKEEPLNILTQAAIMAKDKQETDNKSSETTE